MADLLPTDVLLVNRAGVDYSVPQSDVMADVLDTDLLLVNRAGVDYQTSYADVKKGFGPEKIKPAPADWTTGAAITGGTGTQVDPFIITAGTAAPAGATIQSGDIGTLTGLKANNLTEWTVKAGGDRFKQGLGVVPASGTVAFDLTYTDTPASTTGQVYNGELQIGTTFFKWDVTQVTGTINKPAITAPANGAGELVPSISDEITTYVSGTKTLTFSGDKDLTKFKALDKVQQDSGHIPTSSVITGVSADGKTLTLTDNTDLANFREDDYVIGSNTQLTKTGSITNENFGSNVANGTGGSASWDTSADGLGNSYGGGAKWDATGAGVTIGNPALFSPGTGDFTLCLWERNAIKAVSGTNNYAFNVGQASGSGTGRCFMARMGVSAPGDGSLRAMIFGQEYIYTNLPINTWTHLAVQRKNGDLTFFQDGVVKHTITTSDSFVAGPVAPCIGSSTSTSSGLSWYGHLQDFVFANHALFDPSGFTPPPQAVQSNGALNTWCAGSEFVVPLNDIIVSPRGVVSVAASGALVLKEVVGTFATGTTVIGPTLAPATGTIASVNAVAKTMTFSVSDETSPKRWIVNHGKSVKGAPTLSADAAPDVALITFVSSAYTTTPVGAAATMPHFSTDWEVYAKADTAHATLVFGATADKANLTSWPGAQNHLTADTAYRARIRYHAASADSPWSDDITFKTKA